MEINRVKYFYIFVEDQPGSLGRVMRFFQEEGIDVDALWGFGVGRGRCQIFVVPKDPGLFLQTVSKAGWEVKDGTCFQLACDDEIGAFVQTLDNIAEAGINLNGVDSLAVSGRVGGYIWPAAEDVEKLGEILGT